MTYVRIKQNTTLEDLGITFNTSDTSDLQILAKLKAKTSFLSCYVDLLDETASVNTRLGRIPVKYVEEVYRYYHVIQDNKTIVVAHTGTKHSRFTLHLKHDRISIHERNCTEFTDEEYENYIPVMQNYQMKSLDEGDLDTVITAPMEFLVEEDYSILLEEAHVQNKTIRIDGHKVKTTDLIPFVSNEISATRNPPIIWSTERTRRLTLDTDYLKEQLRVRYAFFERPLSGLSNIVLDSFMPRLMYLSGLNVRSITNYLNIPKTAVTISPWFASILGVKQVPISQLIRILGYTEKDIKLLFNQVRKKRLTLNMVGFGGTSVNTLHWLHEMSMLTNSINLFKAIRIWEPENVEISNLLRFPLNPIANISTYPSQVSRVNKLDLINGELTRLSQNKPETYKEFLKPENYNTPYSTEYYDSTEKRVPYGEETYSLPDKTQIIYGAPNIATREILSPVGNFISATHADSTCRIDLNPAQNTDLQVESYGMISLAAFFMNQLRMSIGLLELLASDQDLMEQDKTILEYQFEGKRLLPTDREYNFQLSHSGLVLTPEEANNV